MNDLYDNELLKVLLKIIYLIDYMDNYTLQHSENVTKYVLLMGKELKMDDEDLKILEIGAMLHDIGKIGVPDYILIKNSNLTKEEYESIKKHVIIGEAILPSSGYEKIKSMIRSHHERLDGRGYPDGLKNGNIPYFARILSIADTFDAMTTQRTYNKPKTLDEAFSELLRVSEKRVYNDTVFQQLDPYLVKVFIQCIKNDFEIMEKFKNRNLSINDKVKTKK